MFHLGARWKATFRGGTRKGQVLSKEEEEMIAKSPEFSAQFSKNLMAKLAAQRAAHAPNENPNP